MLMPKRVKRRKQFRGTMKGKALRGNKISYGEYGIVAMEPCWIRSNQIEAARVAMTRYIKRGGKVCAFLSLPGIASRSQQNRLRLVWVVEKVLLSIGQQ